MSSKKTVYVGNVPIGGGNPVIIQSMANTDTKDYEKTLQQIEVLHEAGASVMRVAFYDAECAGPFRRITEKAVCPVVADIHFDWKLAVSAIENGAAKIRINPGNIAKRNLLKIIDCAKANKVPVRIGVNSGSLEREILEKYSHPSPEALAESAVNAVRFFNENSMENIIISIKSSDVSDMVRANTIVSEQIEYPLHIGVTEAGGMIRGTIKNSIGIGSLLMNGIGDTIRVSLSEDPQREIETAIIILRSLHMYRNAPDIIACPTCSRSTFDVINAQKIVEEKFGRLKKDVSIAVMGCVVNGPGEAKEADYGITGAGKSCILFKEGGIVFRGTFEEVLERLEKEVNDE